MKNASEKLKNCYESVAGKITVTPGIGIVLGSGLGGYADRMDVRTEIRYEDIEGFPVSTVKGHNGRYLFGTLNGREVVMMQGRVHYYEGYEMSDVVLPVRLMGMMGVKAVVLTNAAGGMNPAHHPGILMMITDHIASFVPSPLRGPNIDVLGLRFPDMSHVYDPALQEKIRQAAKDLDLHLYEGVYLQHPGPNFETPAEIRAYRSLGADAVGMSTACEAVALNHMGVKVCGISCITNLCAGMNKKPLTHEEVQETADLVAESFQGLLTKLVSVI